MARWNKEQKQFVADFLNNLSIVILTLGTIQALFNLSTPLTIFFIQFTIALGATTLIFLVSFKLLKK